MKIKRSKWHYKFWLFLHFGKEYGPEWVGDFLWGRKEHPRFTTNPYFIPWKIPQPSTLCKYFWFVVFWFFFFIFAGVAIGVILLIVLGGIFIVDCARWGWSKASAHLPERPEREPKPEKPPREPGILVTFAKAKKNKVCPLIQIID